MIYKDVMIINVLDFDISRLSRLTLYLIISKISMSVRACPVRTVPRVKT